MHDGFSLPADKKNVASTLYFQHWFQKQQLLDNTETLVTVIVSVERAAGWNNSSYSLTTAHSF